MDTKAIQYGVCRVVALLTGRWNHNPSRVQTLIQALNDADCNVQLRHIATETSWTDRVDHGYIAVIDADGTKILRRDGFQHNMNLRQGGAYDMSAVKAVADEVSEFLAKAAAKEVPKEDVPSASLVNLSLTEEQKATAGAPAA